MNNSNMKRKKRRKKKTKDSILTLPPLPKRSIPRIRPNWGSVLYATDYMTYIVGGPEVVP